MKCPLNQRMVQSASATLEHDFGECLQAECAVFDKEYQMCALPAMTFQLYQLNKNLANIASLMLRGGKG